MEHDSTTWAWFKVLLAWLGAWWSHTSGGDIVMFLTGVFTALQIYKTWRELRTPKPPKEGS